MCLRTSDNEAVIKRREGKVCDYVRVSLNLPHLAPVLSSRSIFKFVVKETLIAPIGRIY